MLIVIEIEKFAHLLACMANQKYIHEMTKEKQVEWQEQIDKAWLEGMNLLHSYKQPPLFAQDNDEAMKKSTLTDENLKETKKLGGNEVE